MGGRMDNRQRRRLVACVSGLTLALAAPAASTQMRSPWADAVVMHPTVSDYAQVSASETPPTTAQCASAGRDCFGPAATHAAYNLNALYAQGFDGRGQTIAIVDAFGSDTIAHDLHVYNNAWGLQHMCG